MALLNIPNLYLFLAVFGLLLGKNNLRAIQASSDGLPLSKDGEVIVEGLFPITNKDGRLHDGYLVAAEAMMYEIENINRRNDTLPSIQLGYRIIDDKGDDIHLIMDEAIRIVSKHRPRSVCRADEQFCAKDAEPSQYSSRHISALIGPATSGTTVPVASLLGLYRIPLIGYVASSSLLSDKSRFKSFLRTIPSDDYQTKAIASFVKYFGWNYVFFVGNDDEYGRQGLSSFKNAARSRKVCTSDEVNIAFGNDDVDKQIRKVVEKIAAEKRVRVVILFMFGSQAAKVVQEAESQGLRNITWIFSDGVGRSILKYVKKELIHGAFAVDFVYEKIPGFEEHLESITVKTAENNTLTTKLLEENLNCSTQVPLTAGKRQCRDDEKLNLSRDGITNNWSLFVNVINSVRAIAYGLDNLMKCQNGYGLLAYDRRCPNKTLPVKGKDLFMYIRNASFIGAINERVAFDEKGDRVTKEYIFRNYVYNPEKAALEFRTVANWSSNSPEKPNFSASGPDNGITWNGDKKPEATCSPVCQPGEKQVGQSDCCWACHPCPKGEISNGTAPYCVKCSTEHYANEKQTECLKIGVDYLKASDPFSVIIIVISCLGLVTMVIIALLFIYVRETPVVQDSDQVLLGLFVLSTILAFVFPIFQVSLYRSDDACRFLGAFLLFTVLLVSVTLLAKTKTCDNYLNQFTSHFGFLKPVTHYNNLIMIASSVFFQILLLGVWFLTDSPVVQMTEQSKDVYLRQCSSHWSAIRFVVYGFPLLILFLATAFAFKERDLRENHSEPKYISFCTISMCIILIAFFPTYRFVKGVTTSVVIATTSIVGALAVSGCLILPKVYILVFRPERNVHGHDRSNEPTVSSAHTAGSHHGSSSHHHCEDAEEQLRGPYDVEVGSSSSSANSKATDGAKDTRARKQT